MTDPDRTAHSTEPAEGADDPGASPDGRTPHPDEPAEGSDDAAGGTDTPDAR
jgi:ribokinase